MTTESIPVAFSPCPNDTFIFHAWTCGKLDGSPIMQPILADIQQLNEWLHEGRYPVTKASVASIRQVLDDYIILPVGAAIGFGCGPIIISKEPFSLEEISSKKVALPGKDTTAHLLFEHLCKKPTEKIFCTYDQIIEKIVNDEADCGVIIHETRFTYQKFGLTSIADLGDLWEKKTSLPIPLGVTLAKRSLGNEKLQEITHTIQRSIEYAKSHAEAAKDYISSLSQEKNNDVNQKHIDLYVSEETYQLSPKGMRSIATLLRLPETTADWLLPIEPIYA